MEQSDRTSQQLRAHSRQLSRASSLRKFLPHVRRRVSIASPSSLSSTTISQESIQSYSTRVVLGEASLDYLPNVSSGGQANTSAALQEVAAQVLDTAGNSPVTPAKHWLLHHTSTPQLASQASLPGTKERQYPETQVVSSAWNLRKHVGHKAQRQVLQKTMKNPNTNLGISVSAASRDQSRPVPSPLGTPRTPRTPHSPSDVFKLDPPASSPHMTAAPPPPRQPSPGALAKASKSFFSNKGASRSTTKLPKSISPVKGSNSSPKPQGSLASVYNMNRGMGSSPELTVTNGSTEFEGQASSFDQNSHLQNESHMVVPNYPVRKKPSKHKIFGIGRKGSIKDEEIPRDLRLERGISENSATSRNHSADGRAPESRDTGSSYGIRHTGTRAADGLGRAAKGLFGKLSSRSGGGNDSSREASDRQAKAERDAAEAQKAFLTKSYKVIHQALEVQTRTTRICKRLEDCKDKTEFWLPALAYRCIDYLNDKGMTHEGLYRVPGSEREIRNWLWRFDNEHDIDLLSEEELYDINTISSMFKAWLRDLPGEVFPKNIQHRIAATIPNLNEHPDAPELLKSELSSLPPFNYYLLFAVTAHITMLLNASKENKMTFHNLCVCFMPALKMELPCFSWLILDWKNCWQGCATEKEYLNREYSMTVESVDHSEALPSRSIPVQHFDRYPPPHAKSHGSDYERDGMGSISTSASHTSPQHRPSDDDRGFMSGGAFQSTGNNDSTHSSPAKRSVDAPVAMPSIRPSNSRRGKKPLPLESTLLGSVRRPSESSVHNIPDGLDKSNWAENRNGHAPTGPGPTDAQVNTKPGLLPELAPVQPLSPFGGLESFQR